MRGDERVTVVFFGDAAVEECVLCESINFAVLKKLPVVFVCENNAYSVNSPLSVRQPPEREIYEIARGHGMESFQADGNDVIAVFQLAGKAVQNARRGNGPTFLEFNTYRWLEHCGPNDDSHLECRSEVELQEWKDRCPVRMLEDRLLSEGIATREELSLVAEKIASEMEEAVRFAKSSEFPEPDLLLKHIYAP
jgi:pyruvate dehydrogenase E1 component alpha subunit